MPSEEKDAMEPGFAASEIDTRPSASATSGAPWRLLGIGACTIAIGGLTAYLHPALGQVVASVDIIGPLLTGLILLTAILFGSERTCERVFRLLRWVADRPEPAAPARLDGHHRSPDELSASSRPRIGRGS